MPLQPKYLDYENSQLLLIGHKEDSLDKGTVPQKEDQEENKDAPKDEMEKLEHEDKIRVEHLKGTIPYSRRYTLALTDGSSGDDSVFEDLNISAKDYPKLQTTW